jgi:hypothetical protein
VTTNIQHIDIEQRDGVLVGPLRRPRNLASTQRGSIHDDATAQKLGFRGGTVAGSIHMEQFPPLLVRAFGARWFETGSLSTYFRNATTDGEPVRAFVGVPGDGASDAQVPVRMERDDGTLVLEGSASVGMPDEPSMIARKLAEPREDGELRILGDIKPGTELTPVRARLRRTDIERRLGVMTEPMEWYEGDSPWGGAVANPGLVVHLMTQIQPSMRLRRGGSVGLYGGIEVRHVRGPVFVEHDYEIAGTVLGVGQTPKTEYVWYEARALDAADGAHVATMTMMLRFMKASSELWNA